MGHHADQLHTVAAADPEKLLRVCVEELDRMFAGVPSQAYLDGVVQDWTAEPHVRGSYSYPMQRTYTSVESSKRKDLRISVEDKVFFAGEATNHHNPSTVPGAVQEGQRVARTLDGLL